MNTKIIDAVIKNIEPIWCMDAKIICAPDSNVKIPKKICTNREIKMSRDMFLKYIYPLFFIIIYRINK